HGRENENVAHVRPMLALQYRPVAVNVVKTFGQVVVVLLRAFAQIARAVALARLAPRAFIERHAQHRKVRFQIIELVTYGAPRNVRTPTKVGWDCAPALLPTTSHNKNAAPMKIAPRFIRIPLSPPAPNLTKFQ